MALIKPTVLVCDDLLFNRLVLSRLFRKLGFTVLEAQDGAQAVAMYSGRPSGVQLVMMDLVMPVMDGYAATRALRQYEQEMQLPRCPIVACTAELSNKTACNPEVHASERIVLAACSACGMDHAVGKPVTLELVSEVLRKHALLHTSIAPPKRTALQVQFALSVESDDKLNRCARPFLSQWSADCVRRSNAEAARRASMDDPARPRKLQSLSSHSGLLLYGEVGRGRSLGSGAVGLPV